MVELDEINKQLEQIKAQQLHRSRNKFYSVFPETGPLRRGLYPKHLEWFRASKFHREVGFIAGNRCLTLASPVETGRGERQISELVGETGFDVRSWDGSSRCTKRSSAVVLRGIEPTFRIHLDNGQVFESSGRHRVLACEALHAPPRWLTVSQLIRGVGGLRWYRGASGYPASYGGDGHLGGEQLHGASAGDRGELPKRSGAPSTGQGNLREGEAASIPGCIRAYQDPGRPSTLDERNRLWDLCDWFLNQDRGRDAQPKHQKSRRFSRSVLACSQHQVIPESSGSQVRSDAVLPKSYPSAWFLFPSIKIVAVEAIGWQPVLDFEVDGTHNYFGSGVIHHNCGKSFAGAFATTAHLTGIYPDWWLGRRFEKPIMSWACGTTTAKTMEVVQTELVGLISRDENTSPHQPIGLGTGMIPADLIASIDPHPQIRNALKGAWVKHVTGRRSYVGFRSYEQGREAFEGTAQDLIWLDEECPYDIYVECLMRTMTTNGLILVTETPLKGLTETVAQFMPEGQMPRDQVPV